MPRYAVFENDDCLTLWDIVDAVSPIEACLKANADNHMLHPGTRDYEIVTKKEGAALRVLEVSSDTFVNLTQSDDLDPDWDRLRSSDPAVKNYYQEFLTRHGSDAMLDDWTAEDSAPDPVVDLDKVAARLSVLKAAAGYDDADVLEIVGDMLRKVDAKIATGYATDRDRSTASAYSRLMATMMEDAPR